MAHSGLAQRLEVSSATTQEASRTSRWLMACQPRIRSPDLTPSLEERLWRHRMERFGLLRVSWMMRVRAWCALTGQVLSQFYPAFQILLPHLRWRLIIRSGWPSIGRESRITRKAVLKN